jgi:2-methylcitrate dehydratase PrpD
VTVTLRDGSRLCDASDYPRGNSENPIDRRELEAKFVGLVAPRLGSAAATRALSAVSQLATSADMSTARLTP